ncbi:CpsD/CapB family tyrosine-protein kinase [Bacillus timonensis]|nr:CpsD/CapB family tyrosine-protein kinase [Bacillus timonensis]
MSRKLEKHLRINIERAKYTHLYHRSHVSEQFRTLRTNISFLGIGHGVRTIMVTSASQGEGKTTTLANLSIVLAQQGKRVLLIDADLRRPNIYKMFGLSNEIGLSNVLSNMSYVENAICNSDIANLSILPSGPIPPNPSELLSSNTMKEIIDEVKDDYDIVLFDTPAILDVSDSQLIADLCQGAILVIRSGKTNRDNAIKAKEKLLNTNARLLGVLLNDGNPKVLN